MRNVSSELVNKINNYVLKQKFSADATLVLISKEISQFGTSVEEQIKKYVIYLIWLDDNKKDTTDAWEKYVSRVEYLNAQAQAEKEKETRTKVMIKDLESQEQLIQQKRKNLERLESISNHMWAKQENPDHLANQMCFEEVMLSNGETMIATYIEEPVETLYTSDETNDFITNFEEVTLNTALTENTFTAASFDTVQPQNNSNNKGNDVFSENSLESLLSKTLELDKERFLKNRELASEPFLEQQKFGSTGKTDNEFENAIHTKQTLQDPSTTLATLSSEEILKSLNEMLSKTASLFDVQEQNSQEDKTIDFDFDSLDGLTEPNEFDNKQDDLSTVSFLPETEQNLTLTNEALTQPKELNEFDDNSEELGTFALEQPTLKSEPSFQQKTNIDVEENFLTHLQTQLASKNINDYGLTKEDLQTEQFEPDPEIEKTIYNFTTDELLAEEFKEFEGSLTSVLTVKNQDSSLEATQFIDEEGTFSPTDELQVESTNAAKTSSAEDTQVKAGIEEQIKTQEAKQETNLDDQDLIFSKTERTLFEFEKDNEANMDQTMFEDSNIVNEDDGEQNPAGALDFLNNIENKYSDVLDLKTQGSLESLGKETTLEALSFLDLMDDKYATLFDNMSDDELQTIDHLNMTSSSLQRDLQKIYLDHIVKVGEKIFLDDSEYYVVGMGEMVNSSIENGQRLFVSQTNDINDSVEIIVEIR